MAKELKSSKPAFYAQCQVKQGRWYGDGCMSNCEMDID